MKKKMSKSTRDSLSMIIPGKTYAQSIVVVEKDDDGKMVTTAFINHSIPGRIASIGIFPDGGVMEKSDEDNKSVMESLLKDIEIAVEERGATVTVGHIAPVIKGGE